MYITVMNYIKYAATPHWTALKTVNLLVRHVFRVFF